MFPFLHTFFAQIDKAVNLLTNTDKTITGIITVSFTKMKPFFLYLIQNIAKKVISVSRKE